MDPEKDRSLLNVQCESCHGPMFLHVQEAERGGIARPGAGLSVTEQTCLRCHDRANSPGFEFEAYMARIKHPGLL